MILTLSFIFTSLYPDNQDVVTCEGSRLLLQISVHTHIQKYTLQRVTALKSQTDPCVYVKQWLWLSEWETLVPTGLMLWLCPLISVFSLPHPCTVTSSFLPNCPSLMDNCNNNYLCVYIFLHSLCFCCCQMVSQQRMAESQLNYIWCRIWRQRNQQMSRCFWQKAPA